MEKEDFNHEPSQTKKNTYHPERYAPAPLAPGSLEMIYAQWLQNKSFI